MRFLYVLIILFGIIQEAYCSQKTAGTTKPFDAQLNSEREWPQLSSGGPKVATATVAPSTPRTPGITAAAIVAKPALPVRRRFRKKMTPHIARSRRTSQDSAPFDQSYSYSDDEN